MEESEITPELRNLLVNFVGQTYGEMHKLDKDIVQTATNLQPTSEFLKAKAPSIINSFTPQRAQIPHPNFTSAPTPQATFHQAPTQNTQVVDPNQLEFNFQSSGVSEQLLGVLRSIDSKLDSITTNLEVIVERLGN